MKFAPVPGTEVLFGIWPVRVRDYRAFSVARQHPWPKPDFAQDETHPAVNVSWNDAKAFCAWLTEKERREGRLGPRQSYRLPRDWEWSVAVGLVEPREGSPKEKDRRVRDVYPWGTTWPPPAGAGNYAGEETGRSAPLRGYRDGFEFTSPVGSFAVNRFGLFDMGGNVWQWCEDLGDADFAARVARGGSFGSADEFVLLASYRGGPADSATARYSAGGFRCVVGWEEEPR